MTASSPLSDSSLLLVADLDGSLQRYLRTQVPASARWKVQSCSSAEAAISLPSHEVPNLAVVVCQQDDAILCFDLLRLLEYAKRHWPYTFFILASARPLRNLEVVFERFGEMPVVDLGAGAKLGETVEREMASGTFGLVRGVTLPSFLQIMAWEKKSLSIRVESGPTWGRLHLLEGRLVGAYSDATGQEGEEAALDILAWDTVSLRIERSYHNRRGSEMRDLNHLLMDAMKKKDEGAKEETAALAEDLLLYDDPDDLASLDGPEDFTALLEELLPSGEEEGEAAPAPVRRPREADWRTSVPVREVLGLALGQIGGAVTAALVDWESGEVLECQGRALSENPAAAGSAEMVRVKLEALGGAPTQIEDLVLTLGQEYHLLTPLPGQPLFLALILDRREANLAAARATLRALVSSRPVA